MKAVQASAADSIQIVNETTEAEQLASTTSNDQQGEAESAPLVANEGKEDKKEEPEEVSNAPTETTPLEDTSNGPTVTVEVWKGWQQGQDGAFYFTQLNAFF